MYRKLCCMSPRVGTCRAAHDGQGGRTAVDFARIGRFRITAFYKPLPALALLAAVRVYAEAVLDAIIPPGAPRPQLLSREHCVQVPSGNYVKDLRVLGRPLHKVVIVDNTPFSFGCHPANAGIASITDL